MPQQCNTVWLVQVAHKLCNFYSSAEWHTQAAHLHALTSGLRAEVPWHRRFPVIWLLRPATCALQRRAAAFEARAAAADVAEAPAQQFPSPVAGLSDEQRAELAQELGYRQIGKDLPSDVTLQRVISTLPKDVSTCSVFSISCFSASYHSNIVVISSPCL